MLKKFTLQYILFFYYLFKKSLFFIKYKKYKFLYFFLKTEINKTINKYLNKKFKELYHSKSSDYNTSKFKTHNPKTKKWFKHNIIYILLAFKKFDLDLIKNNILEIGTYEGNSAIFFLQNLRKSSINCVDSWSDLYTAGNKNRELSFNTIKKNFDINIMPYKDRVVIHHSLSNKFFAKNKLKYDLIYVDGSHTYDDVLYDGSNSVKLLNNNGLIIFDDVFKPGVFEAIIKIYENNNLKIEFIYHQAIFRYIQKN